jgi:alpha-L-arabinofuranosidase
MVDPISSTVSLRIDEARHFISRHIYGHFAEHLGHGIYGGFYVGEYSSIPNVNGIRLDVIEALKKIRVPNLRWPGGCFADTYQWKDGIGPRGDRPSIVNTWWGGQSEDNSFGTHEFLTLCELLGAEPFISANVGSGTVKDLMDWVQYVNYEGVSPMSDLRKRNGRDSAWRVRYWGLGNEAWGCGGNMRPEYYADFFRQYATFMSDWSNSTNLFRIASGPQSADYHWTDVLMRNVPHRLMEGIGLHHYAVIDWNDKGPASGFSMDQYFRSMQRAWMMDELIRGHAAIMDRYDPANKVALVVDEWGGWYDPEPGTNPGFLHQQNTMRDAMIAGVTLNIFNNHAARVRMANLAQAVNVLQCVIMTKDEHLLLTPTYHVMDMYQGHQDCLSVPVEVRSYPYIYNGETLPSLSASASLSQENKLFVTLVNINSQPGHLVRINTGGACRNATATILQSRSVGDFNSFNDPTLIEPRMFGPLRRHQEYLEVEMPGRSIVAISIT